MSGLDEQSVVEEEENNLYECPSCDSMTFERTEDYSSETKIVLDSDGTVLSNRETDTDWYDSGDWRCSACGEEHLSSEIRTILGEAVGE